MTVVFPWYTHTDTHTLPHRRPVNRAECPDYDSFVSNPIDLAIITARVQNSKYGSGSDFGADMELLASNCAAYCSEKFPALVTKARQMAAQATSAVSVGADRAAQGVKPKGGGVADNSDAYSRALVAKFRRA